MAVFTAVTDVRGHSLRGATFPAEVPAARILRINGTANTKVPRSGSSERLRVHVLQRNERVLAAMWIRQLLSGHGSADNFAG